jgi:hypothetical protein
MLSDCFCDSGGPALWRAGRRRGHGVMLFASLRCLCMCLVTLTAAVLLSVYRHRWNCHIGRELKAVQAAGTSVLFADDLSTCGSRACTSSPVRETRKSVVMLAEGHGGRERRKRLNLNSANKLRRER